MTPAPRKLSFYLRVSRSTQTIASQLHALREYCKRHGWPLPKKEMIYQEKASGALVKRTQLDRLVQACVAGNVDTILCYQIDRIGRSFLHLVNLMAQFERLKIRVIGISDGMDTAENSPHVNQFRRTMMSAAEYQRELIVERTNDGLAAARKRGRFGGRPRENDAKIAAAKKLLQKNPTIKKPLSLRAVARAVDLDPGYLSRELKKK